MVTPMQKPYQPKKDPVFDQAALPLDLKHTEILLSPIWERFFVDLFPT